MTKINSRKEGKEKAEKLSNLPDIQLKKLRELNRVLRHCDGEIWSARLHYKKEIKGRFEYSYEISLRTDDEMIGIRFKDRDNGGMGDSYLASVMEHLIQGETICGPMDYFLYASSLQEFDKLLDVTVIDSNLIICSENRKYTVSSSHMIRGCGDDIRPVKKEKRCNGQNADCLFLNFDSTE